MGLNKPSKLGLAILEGFVGKHLGEGFVDELKSGFQSHDNLIRAMLETERIFRKTCEDKAFCKTIFDDLPITDLEPIQQAAQSFYSNPSDPILSETLKRIFVRDLKRFVPVEIENYVNSYVSVLTQQLTVLDRKFSEQVNTFANLAAAEVAKETLKVMKGVAKDIHKISVTDEQALIKRFEKVASQEQEITFSEEIRTQLSSVNKTIEALTKDQFQVINWLRGTKRAAISGCAGSGKTLVAVEKAIRLSHAGLRTLILCHSPNLALYIENLTKNTGVQVCDFSNWIKRTLAKKTLKNYTMDWTHFEEPADEELSLAFDSISTSVEKFDSIIVDEGQDFRDSWWLIIEEALSSQEYGILYIFFDDNQALLPNRATYPVEISPYSLSKNCRNAGNVFEFVKHFHPQAPEESFFLSSTGYVKLSSFSSRDEAESTLIESVSEALKFLDSSRLVLLTTEPVPLSESMIDNLDIFIKPTWSWQESVRNELLQIARQYRHWKPAFADSMRVVDTDQVLRELDELSNAYLPTKDDIERVIHVARHFLLGYIPDMPAHYRPIWRLYDSTNSKGKQVLTLNSQSSTAKIHLFCSSAWVDTLPKVDIYRIRNAEKAKNKPNHIPLYSVSSFKGLEADGIIFFVRSLQDKVMPTILPDLYVGSSRARFYLHLVVHNDAIKYIPKRYTN